MRAKMVSCSEFRRDFSDYRDGCLDAERYADIDAHLADCAACSRHLEAFEFGLSQLRLLPEITPSSDFIPRLQHRLYHLDEETKTWRRGERSAASTGFVLTITMLIAAAAWLPVGRSRPPLVVLAPAVATAPQKGSEVPALFREGPLLTNQLNNSEVGTNRTLLYRYTRLGSYASSRPVSSPR